MNMTKQVMHLLKQTLIIVVLLNSISDYKAQIKQSIPKYSTSEAVNHVSEYATVYGKVYQVHYSKKGHIFINLDGNYPNQKFVGFIFKSNAYKFNNLQYLTGKYIELTGRISMYKTNYEIIIDEPQQIKILNQK